MIDVSTLVRSQFPQIYQEEGEEFIAFIEAYYEWFETSHRIRSADLTDLRDIDTTVDEFVQFFKNKYLVGLPNLTRGDLRQFIKHSKDLFESKGTEKSIQLLLQLLFDVESEVYHPGDDVLRASAGQWHQPVYLEVTPSEANKLLINKQVTGATSGASAIVESVVRRITNGIYFDVVYLSSVEGNFLTGERISASGMLENAPTIRGSLNNILITNGGKGNQIGDVFRIVSKNGKQGIARVTGIENGTGRVDFELIDGGSGYSLNADAVVATRMYGIANTIGSGFNRFETVRQKLHQIDYASGNGSFAIGDIINSYTSGTWIKQANGVIVDVDPTSNTTTGTVTIQVDTGDFRLADVIRKQGNTVGALIDTSQSMTATGNVVGSNSTYIGVFDIVNTFRIIPNITKLRGLSSNTTTTVVSQGTGSGANFSIGSIENEETVFLNTDFWKQKNSANVPYLEVGVDGSGSGVGFVDKVAIAETLTVSNAAHTFATDDICWQADSSGEVYARGRVHTATPSEIVAFADLGVFDTAYPLLKGGSSTPVTAAVTNRGSGYANGDVVTFSGGGKNITSVTVINGGTGYANGEHVAVVGDTTNESVVMSVITDASGTIVTVNVVESPVFKVAPELTVLSTGTGADLEPVLSNPDQATGVVLTDASGGLLDISMGHQGSGYFNRPSITFPAGTGALVSATMDYGYGLPKNIHGDLWSTINETLMYSTITAGSISSLSGLALGESYNVDPFIAVTEGSVAGLDRRNFVLSLSNSNGAFVVGEFIEQDTIDPAFELTFVSGPGSQFQPYELVYGPNGSGLAYSVSPTYVRVVDSLGSFAVGDTIVGSASGASAVLTGSNTIARMATAKGEVISSNSSVMFARRTSINTSFKLGQNIRGRRSGATSTVVAMDYDYTLEAMGNNAIVSATVKTANGIATSVEIMDSGFGYGQNEYVELTNNDNPNLITGIASLERQGGGEGFWISTAGFLSNDQYLHDGEYYQAYSYEVRTPYSLERYADVLKKLVHVAGTAMFGRVVMTPSIDTVIDISTECEQFESVPQILLGGTIQSTSSVTGQHTKAHINAVLLQSVLSSITNMTGQLTLVPINVVPLSGSVDGVTNITGTLNVG